MTTIFTSSGSPRTQGIPGCSPKWAHVSRGQAFERLVCARADTDDE
jgi:hypothetical protein